MKSTAAGGLGLCALVIRSCHQRRLQNRPAPLARAVLYFAAVLGLPIDSNLHLPAFVDPVSTGSVPF
jgi:hypothetical protein